MKNIEELIQKAVDLQAKGLVTGQVADELNVSRETATWLLSRARKGEEIQAPKDISVDWSSIGKSSYRLRYISKVMADMVLDLLSQTNEDVDTIVGTTSSGVPIASLMAEELGTEFAVFHVLGQRVDNTHPGGIISRNFGNVDGKRCIIVDDVITSGSTISQVIKQLKEFGALPVGAAVLVDKRGTESISSVPVKAMIRIMRMD
ncbi:orotate phosphoribosyltransferase-like protein [Methanosalsum natronophilum]|nr:orotate phosphoribosyltransferase-like protein [Methanosalsum natronophilum]MCS3924343.1 orotate phosphoribosyltransferase [Methanosalsum natronophilum]